MALWSKKKEPQQKPRRTLADIQSSAIVTNKPVSTPTQEEDVSDKEVVSTFITELTTAILSTIAENYLPRKDADNFISKEYVEQNYVTRAEYDKLKSEFVDLRDKWEEEHTIQITLPAYNMIPVSDTTGNPPAEPEVSVVSEVTEAKAKPVPVVHGPPKKRKNPTV